MTSFSVGDIVRVSYDLRLIMEIVEIRDRKVFVRALNRTGGQLSKVLHRLGPMDIAWWMLEKASPLEQLAAQADG